VGTPDRKSLWMLARTPTISDERYAALIARAEQLGFDLARMIKDPQPSPSNTPKAPE
jgi:apolipoprotein D and lipocalin family protein